MKGQLKDIHLSNLNQLSLWRLKTTPELCHTLAASMPCQMEAMIKSGGEVTKY